LKLFQKLEIRFN